MGQERIGCGRLKRWVLPLLVVSGLLNLIFGIALVLKRDPLGLRQPVPFTAPKSILATRLSVRHLPLSMSKLLSCYRQTPFRQLLPELLNTDHVAHGQRHCDLVLAALVSFHHFDLTRALGGHRLEQKPYDLLLEDGRRLAVILFPALSEPFRRQIIDFAHEDLWPLTLEGLFLAIKHRGDRAVPSLKQAFMQSDMFHLITLTFRRLALLSSEHEMLTLLTGVNFTDLEELTMALEQLYLNGEEVDRVALLTFLLHGHAPLVAQLLLEVPLEHLLERLCDRELLALISQLEACPQQEVARALLEQVQTGIRCERVRRVASGQLELSQHWVQRAPSGEQVVEHPPPLTRYLVKKGDTLWQLAQDFNVSVTQLRHLNDVKGDLLLPGHTLLVPALFPNRSEFGSECNSNL